ncbi:helix-turn-helix domain-containing protein [Mucilaginibacter gossypii]|uniref:helix-turn-helix domain-containing protein n=1 Tax=Mucilaginibacter gossypii TaxID=551996 RepID=UPI000DCF1F79|nr:MULTISPECIES: helix-turn-helix domain-containing protein [Mucilaginibacter]QTE36112.1 helix-turn-helix domain-containing protein [Mucilaginibacter gossypii]RAV59974.1 hypothetical protein DIU36_03100 [Mucilaginibacter rubeus]
MKKSNAFNEAEGQEKFKSAYEMFKRDHRTLVAPTAVFYDQNLTIPARILFTVIIGLSFKQGYCYATNDYLAAKLNVKRTTIIKYVAELEKQALITREPFVRKMMKRRKIYVQFAEMCKRYPAEIETA